MEFLQKLLLDTASVGHIVVLFAFIIALGMWLGKQKIAGISLGATFVLFVGILVGHIYFSGGWANEENLAAPSQVLTFMQDFGLILFVYCIGLQVGPGFFNTFKKGGGLQMNYIALGIIFLDVAVMLALFYLCFDASDKKSLSMLVGVLYGAVTNTPGLGAAQEALKSTSVDWEASTSHRDMPAPIPSVCWASSVLPSLCASSAVFRSRMKKRTSVANRKKTRRPSLIA